MNHDHGVRLNSTVLPDELRAELEKALGAPVQNVVEVAGGEINRAAQVAVGGEAVFVKWNTQAPADLFPCEAYGLEQLRATVTLRVPKVLAIAPKFLVLEWIAEGIIQDRNTWSKIFAQNLAALHQNMAPDGKFGGKASYLGLSLLNNTSTKDWAAFWRDCRLAPHMETAREKGIGAERVELLQRLCDSLEVKLRYHAQPSLLHGDLWSGNYLAASEGACLVDPAIFYGDREVELSYIELFGGFPPDFVLSYRAAWPLEEGYEMRRPIYQLFYLLVHFNFFGEPYGQDVERVCRRILQTS